MRLRKTKHILLALVLLLSFSLGNVNMAAASGSNTENGGKIQVTGNAVIKVKPDMAIITLGVDTSNTMADLAAQENAERMAQVLLALKELGLSDEEIATTGYNIYSYEQVLGRYSEEETLVTTYHVQNRVQISTKNLDLVGQIVDEAVKAGANQVQGVSFDLADKQELQLQALADAIRQAKTKAEAMAEGAGVVLGEIATITEEYGSYAPMYESMVMKAYDNAAGTILNPGEIEVSAKVTMEFWF